MLEDELMEEIIKLKKEFGKMKKEFKKIKEEREELRQRNEQLTTQTRAYEENKNKRKWLNGFYNE